MRKAILTTIASGVLLAGLASGALGHTASPCNDSGEPGNSDYAQHHIRPMAQAGDLGSGGHVPGSHMGYSACDPSGR